MDICVPYQKIFEATCSDVDSIFEEFMGWMEREFVCSSGVVLKNYLERKGIASVEVRDDDEEIKELDGESDVEVVDEPDLQMTKGVDFIRVNPREVVASRGLLSEVWSHFHFRKDVSTSKTDSKHVYCNHCSTQVARQSGKTSNLWAHLRGKHTKLLEEKAEKETSEATSFFSEWRKKSAPLSKQRRDTVTSCIMSMIALDYQPFSIVEDAGFKGLLEELIPMYSPPSRTSFSRTVMKDMFNKLEREIIETVIDAPYSITIDGWTSSTNQHFLGVTIHFITDDWRLIALPIDVKHVQHECQSDVYECIRDAQRRMCLDPGKLVCVTTDSGGAVLNTGDRMDAMSFACVLHRMNNVAMACSQEPKLAAVIKRVKRLVKHFRKSYVATNALLQQQEVGPGKRKTEKVLISPGKTRWNSLYDAMERVIELRIPIGKVLVEKGHEDLNLTVVDYELVEFYLKAFKPLKQLTQELSTQTAPTIAYAFISLAVVQRHIEGLDLNVDFVSIMQSTFRLKFEKFLHETDPKVLVTIALDPRIKFDFFPDSMRACAQDSLEKELQSMSVQGIEKSKSMVEESQSNDSDTFLLSARRYSTSSVRKTSERDFVSIYDSNSSCGAKACPLQWWRTHSEWSNLLAIEHVLGRLRLPSTKGNALCFRGKLWRFFCTLGWQSRLLDEVLQ